jgi:hypothetical protein
MSETIPFYITDDKCDHIANKLRESWEVEDDDNNDNDDNDTKGTISRVLIFLSKLEMSLCISGSENIQSILTEARIDDIIHEMDSIHWWGGDQDQNDNNDNDNDDLTEGLMYCIQRIFYYFEEGSPTFIDQYGWYILFECYVFVYYFLTGSRAFLQSVHRSMNGSHSRSSQGEDQRRNMIRELSEQENEEATSLMKRYQCYSCPICLEDYQENELSCLESMEEGRVNTETSYGSLPKIEYFGSDGVPIQLLRCGHSSCRRCWDEWISHGKNSTECPVCKRDIGG